MAGPRRGFDIPATSASALLDQQHVVSFAELATFCDQFDAVLDDAGVEPGATVASSVDSDLIGAATSVAALRHHTYAPQNPSLRRGQLTERFGQLGAAAVVVGPHTGDRALEVAHDAGLSVVRVDLDQGVPRAQLVEPLQRAGLPRRPDIRLILHTSGTTGVPRMVPIDDANLAHSLEAMTKLFQIGEADRSLVVMPLFHIHALMASLLVPLSAGAAVAAPGLYDAPAFLGWLTSLEPTFYSAVPTVHHSVVDRVRAHPHELGHHRLRFVRSSSAALGPKALHDLEDALGVPVLEGYAMTEATSQIASNHLPPGARKDGSVGQPVGVSIRIVDGDGNTVPAGSRGSISISGPNVVAGYLENAAATAERFDNGWFDTGDLGYLDSDGELFLTGRLSDVIRRGGEAVSPSDVEEALLRHPAVREAVVFAVPDARLGEQVAAAVIVADGEGHVDQVDEHALRDHVFRRRAPYEVPRRILLVDQLPSGPTGKPVRTGLAEVFGLADLDEPARESPIVAPRTELEQQLLHLWADLLATEVPGVHHHFFELGGDSLLTKSLLLQVRERWGVDVPFIDFFDALTVAEQAELVQELLANDEPALAEPGDPQPSAADEPFPLSRAQERLWILGQIDPDQASYHIPWRMRIDGPLDVTRMEAAFRAVIGRHEPLRTRVVGLVAGEQAPLQLVDPATTFELERGELPDDVRAEQHLLDEHFARPFDLTAQHPIRALLLSRADQHHFSIVIHHTASDGRSLEILARELTQAYAEGNTLEPLTAHYRDYVRWETWRRTTAAYERELDAWTQRLAQPEEALHLPYDREPDEAPGGPAESSTIPLHGVSTAALRELCRDTSATPFMVLLAGFARALAPYARAPTLTIGTPSEDRVWAPSSPLIGYFVNTLPLRIATGGEPTFRELVRRVRRVALDSYQGAEVSFDDIVGAVNPRRSVVRSPLYEVMFTAAVGPPEAPQLGRAAIRGASNPARRTKFNIEVDLRVLTRAVRGSLAYDTRWFEPATGQRLALELGEQLRSGIETPDAR